MKFPIKIFNLLFLLLCNTCSVFAESLDALATKANIAATNIPPQEVYALGEAASLTAAVYQDLESASANSTAAFLRGHSPETPAWQITARAIETFYQNGPPDPAQLAAVEALFRATMRPGDDWLNYTIPRGWTYPYGLRRRLARWIVAMKTNSTEVAVEDQDLLQEAPAKWLEIHGSESVNRNSTDLRPSPSLQQTDGIVSSELQYNQESPSLTSPQFSHKVPKLAAKIQPTPANHPFYWPIVGAAVVACFGLLWLFSKKHLP